VGSDNTGQYLFFAVSKAGGATGWKLYRLVLSLGNQKRFCQKTANGIFFGAIAGFSGKRWLVTLNETSNGITGTGAILSINKAPTLSGSATTVKCVNALLPDIAPPIVRDTSLRAFFLSTGAGPGSTIRRYKLQTGVTPANDVVVNDGPISVPAWASPPRARQPNGALLDTGNGGFFAASIQIGTTLWNVHTIKVGNYARWRLYKFSTAARVPSFTFTPTTTSGRDFLFNASLATTGTATAGRAFVTFSRTIPTNAVSGRLSMMIGAGPNALATGWKFNLIAISPEQVTGCKLAAGYCFFRGSTTQIDPGGGGAWGFSSLFKSQDQFDWITRAAKVN
jgi:hypothetical protein